MDPESEYYPPTDEGNDELSFVYLDECTGRDSEMSFMDYAE